MTEEDELRAIGERLLILAEAGSNTTRVGTKRSRPKLEDTDPDYLASVAQAVYKLRRVRSKHLPEVLFGEPAWDMLLDLYIRRNLGKRTSITSLCVASHVPPTTALRWITMLQQNGLVEREEALHDRRVAYVKLSNDGVIAIEKCLNDVSMHIRPKLKSFLLAGDGM